MTQLRSIFSFSRRELGVVVRANIFFGTCYLIANMLMGASLLGPSFFFITGVGGPVLILVVESISDN
jgi:hypothetical protein